MKRSLFFKRLFGIAFLIGIVQGLRGQSGDEYCTQWQNPLPQGNPLRDVFFTGPMTGWAVGDRGAILRTMNGGTDWHQQPSGINNDLHSLHFTDSLRGWVVGSSGTIRYTQNGGISWQQQSSGTSNVLRSVYFTNNLRGWTVGNSGTIRHTTNGGANWQQQTSGTSNVLRGLYFIDIQNGWVVGNGGTIRHTTNGGADWLPQTSGITDNLYSVHFTDSQTGWAVGSKGKILHTTDGGDNWQQQLSGTADDLFAGYFIDNQTGWVIGDNGTILFTVDGGEIWQQQPSGYSNALYGVHFSDSQTGWAVGVAGMILHTSNSGSNWERQITSATLYGLRSVYFTDNQTGWAVGGGNTILHTSNGGANWQAQTVEDANALYGVHFTDDQTGWAVGSSGTILHTQNGGADWQPQTASGHFWGVYFTDNQKGWVAGNNGVIRHTSNGGANWQTQSSGISERLNAVFFTDSLRGWIVGDIGKILHTSDGGDTWLPQISPTPNTLLDLHFADSLHGWAVGDGGDICFTLNGGETWELQESPTLITLQGVYFTDKQRGWAVGDDGTILLTADGGMNWNPLISGTSNGLYGVHFTDNQQGWAIGLNGTIIKITTQCLPYANTISGKVFRDEGNCLYYGAEQPLKQWLVEARGDTQTFYAVTDTAGRFSMQVGMGTYQLSVLLPNGLWKLCQDSIQLTFNQIYQTIDTTLGVQMADSCAFLQVDIGTPRLRRCYDNFYHVRYCNKGTAPANDARVELQFDTYLDVDTASLPKPWTLLPGNVFSIDLGDVLPAECGSFSVKAKVNCENTNIGDIKCVEARIFPDTLCISQPGWDGSNIVVTVRYSGDTVVFTIRNAGKGDMAQSAEYIIIEDIVLLARGEFQLEAGQDTILFVTDAGGSNWRIEAAQSPEHPFSQIAAASLKDYQNAFTPVFFLQYPLDEASPFVAKDCRPVAGSWDPNDKQCFPQGLDTAYHFIRNNTSLEYLIRFQNTGTDTAFRVVIRDTLSPFLDVASVQPGASSHNYQFEIIADNILKFTFDPIMLPDSNVNEPASHGFVQFTAQQKSMPENKPETRIENTAAIYFDYNAPVFTNEVFHTVAGPASFVFQDTVCDPAAADMLLKDTTRFTFTDLVRLTFFSDTLYTLLDTTVQIGDTIFGVVVLSPVTVVRTLNSAMGCDSILVVHITISAIEPDDRGIFRLAPNPTAANLVLTFESAINDQILAIEIHDITGRLYSVYQNKPAFTADNQVHLKVSELPAGLYFLTLRGADRSWTNRFVKRN